MAKNKFILMANIIKASAIFDNDKRINLNDKQFVAVNIFSVLFALIYFKVWFLLT